MKLSEAIREGAKKRPQSIGAMFEKSADGIKSCALGAAYEAVTGRTDDCLQASIFIVRHFNSLSSHPETLPCGCYVGYIDLEDAIVHLNDKHSYSREQIADWVETIESEAA